MAGVFLGSGAYRAHDGVSVLDRIVNITQKNEKLSWPIGA